MKVTWYGLLLLVGLSCLTGGVADEGAGEEVQHWSYIAPRSPELPELPAGIEVEWGRNPIDRFVAVRLDEQELAPSPRAEARVLLRRLSFDLRGLPPSPDDVDRFVKDSGDRMFAAFVDRWLASPDFGEHRAQGWLDAARYADTAGHAADAPRTMWLYRNWVINALNANMPFDQFTIEQLAGDMIPGASLDQKIATGFHRNSMQALGNNPRKEEFRVKGIVDRIETTGRVWLGLTVACAECHDHKFDPISTEEYYQIYAIFNNVPHLGERFQVHGPRLAIRSDSDHAEWDRLERLIGSKRDLLAQSATNASEGEETPATERLKQEIEAAEKAKGAISERTVIAQVMEEMAEPRKTFVHVRGNFENPGTQVAAAVPAFLPSIPEGQPVNRLNFARWLVDEGHPLTARVTVNRIWAHYFGRGIVPTLDDFGDQGDLPSHPRLLDWLAVRFMESGWDLKAMHRLIVTSRTYQQSSRRRLGEEALDPENRWLSRGPRRRLSAEQIRDNALMLSGLLTTRLGGESVFPPQPEGVGEFRDATAGTWKVSEGEGRYRRSLYTFWQRMSPYPGLTILDAPSRERSCVRRIPTNTPLQALLLLNDPVYVEMAEALAGRVIGSGSGFAERLGFAFRLALARDPNAEEMRQFRGYANELRSSDDLTERVLWRSIAQVLLNLDEVITKE